MRLLAWATVKLFAPRTRAAALALLDVFTAGVVAPVEDPFEAEVFSIIC